MVARRSRGTGPATKGLSVHIVLVSTYPPRKCGIATFSRDLRQAILSADPSSTVEVAASVRPEVDDEPHGKEVVATFEQDETAQYAEVARQLDAQHPDAVIIEHEYGIFGGPDGQDVLELARALQTPFAVTLHTVLAEPSQHQGEVLDELCRLARWVFVFSDRAREFVLARGVADDARVHVVQHGAPSDFLVHEGMNLDQQRAVLKDGLGVDVNDKVLLSTFGLLSPGKGLETAIKALPAIVEKHPEVVYLIAGRTHPEIVRRHGEAYREGLEKLGEELGVGEHLAFANGYLSDEELESVLGATQIFVTPYRAKEQIVSGALTFALAAGCAVVSTPYYYAQDMLGDGAGWLVDFEDPKALADAVVHALDNPDELAAAHRAARRIGEQLAWPSVGQRVLDLLGQES